MKPEKSSVTQKYQATIPKSIRRELGIKPGEQVTWHVLRSMVVVDAHKKIKDPVHFLTSQIRDTHDAVKLVRAVRNELV